MPLTKDQINDIITEIRAGRLSVKALPIELYNEIFGQLETALERGFDLETVKKVSTRDVLSSYLQINTNLKKFAAHKAYQVINSMVSNLTVDDMKATYKKYMKTWQKVENDLVVKQSMTVNDWYLYESQKDVMPYLRYVTAMDEKVRHEHAALHGIIKKVDSPFWDEFMPANGYNCRCTVEQLDMAKESTISTTEMSQHRKKIDLKFRNNPAKSGYIFKDEGKDKHPYFKVPKEAEKEINRLYK